MTTTLDKDTYPIESGYKQRTNSIFASVEIGWKSMLYMTLTGRNDWDSALINTEQSSFFYPSIGLSGVISEMVKLPKAITYLKVRGSFASVGAPIPKNLSSNKTYEWDLRLVNGNYKLTVLCLNFILNVLILGKLV